MTAQEADMTGHTLHVPARPAGALDEMRTLARRGIARRVADPQDRGEILAMLGLDRERAS